MKSFIPSRLPIWLLSLTIFAGCVRRADSTSPSSHGGNRAFITRGIVQELGLDRRTAIIRHEAIPGYMHRMTMEFSVVDPRELEGVRPGDAITFRLVVSKESHWIESIHRARGIATIPRETREEGRFEASKVLKPGDPMPDYELLGEHGEVVRFSDFRGQALAFTFIFTRCPLPDFCPRMSRHFEAARSLLEQEPAGPAKWQFLSISFDPEFDKPGVLAGYARSYRGGHTNRWLFASASANALPDLSKDLDLLINRDKGLFSHNLRTVVLDPLGRVHRHFIGNKWSPKELADSLLEAVKMVGQ